MGGSDTVNERKRASLGEDPTVEHLGTALVGKAIASGKYEIVGLLGEGGMGAVYQARQVAMDRMVALKLIRPEVVTSRSAVARFQKEMLVTAKVEHPNTIRVYDFGEADGQLYLAMEYLAGSSLRQVIDSAGRLELRRIVRIGKQVANALGAIHERGLVHRDLKPENVMLIESYGETDFVKVLDFGIAKSLDDDVNLTGQGRPIGTPAYMSPEQALGRKVDARTDLYALGVMLYRMASGRMPFNAPTAASMLLAHATEAPTPVLTLAPDTSPTLAGLIMQLLDKDPLLRPATAGEVVARLEDCAQSSAWQSWPAGGQALPAQPAEVSASQASAWQASGSQAPGAQAPGWQASGSRVPGSQVPSWQASGSQAPGSHTPQSQPPQSHAPGWQASGSHAPGWPPPPSQPPESHAPGWQASGSHAPGWQPPPSHPPGWQTPILLPAGSRSPASQPPGWQPSDSQPPAAQPPGWQPSDSQPPVAQPPGWQPSDLQPPGSHPAAWQAPEPAPELASASRTTPDPKPGRAWIAVAIVAVLAVAGGIVYVVAMPSGGSGSSGAGTAGNAGNQRPLAGGSAEDSARRAQLDELLAKSEPLAPDNCRAHDPAIVTRLLDAARALGDGQPDRAQQLLAEPGDSCEAWALLSRAQLPSDAEKAQRSAQESARLCPGYAVAYNLSGNALQKLGNVQPAENAYLLALTAAPLYDAPRFNLGLLQLRQNDATAATTFTELLRRRPDYPNAYLARAQAFALQGNNDAALADLEEAIRRQPTSAEAWAVLGEVRERAHKGDFHAAYCRAKELGHARAAARCPK